MSQKKSIFDNAKKTDVLWHDLKRGFTVVSHYVENLRDGVYGVLPKKALAPLSDLDEISQKSLLMIENLMIITKKQQGVWKLHPQELELSDLVERAQSYLDCACALSAKQTVSIKGDRRYAGLAVINILLVFREILKAKTKVKVTQKGKKVHLQFSPSPAKKRGSFPATLAQTGSLIFTKDGEYANDAVLALHGLLLICKEHGWRVEMRPGYSIVILI